MLSASLYDLSLKQRASLASLHVQMTSFIQQVHALPRGVNDAEESRVFHSSFPSPTSKPVDMCTRVVLLGSEILTLCTAISHHASSAQRFESEVISLPVKKAANTILQSASSLDTNDAIVLDCSEVRDSSPLVSSKPSGRRSSDPGILDLSTLNGNGLRSEDNQILECRMLLKTAHDLVYDMTESPGTKGSSKRKAEQMRDALDKIISKKSLLKAVCSERSRLRAAFDLSQVYQRGLKLHREMVQAQQRNGPDPSQNISLTTLNARQIQDVCTSEPEIEKKMFLIQNDQPEEPGTNDDGWNALSPTSPLATLLTTVFSPMNIT